MSKIIDRGITLALLAALGVAVFKLQDSHAPPPVDDPPSVVTAPVGNLTIFKPPQKPSQWIGVPPAQAAYVQVVEYPDHVALCPLREGDFDLGAIVKGKVTWWTIRSGKGPVPPPKPIDPPTPNPEPVDPPKPSPVVPQAPKVAVVIVEDTSKRTVAEGKVIADPKVRGQLAAEGHRVIEFSIADPGYKDHGYEGYVKEVGLPAVIVFDATKIGQVSTPLTYFRLPATGPEFDAAIRKAVKK